MQQQEVQRIKQAAAKSQQILVQLKQKIKQFAIQNQQILCPEQKKILKLFNYAKWQDFIKWIDQKLVESGQAEDSKLSQIQQEEAELQESIEESLTLNQTSMFEEKTQSEMLAVENAKLRKENINLQAKIQLFSSMQSSTVTRTYFRK